MVSPHFFAAGEVFSEIDDFVTGEYEKIPGLANAESNQNQKPPAEKFRDLREKFFSVLQ